MLQERPIGAAGDRENSLGDNPEQVFAAVVEIGPDARVSGLGIDWIAEKARQRANKTPE
jgi:hypothetical protein